MIRIFNGYILFPVLEKISKRHILSKRHALKKYEELSLSDKQKGQREQLHLLLQHCANSIPYYKDLFDSTRFNIDKVLLDIGYLNELPVLTKEIIRDNADRLKTPGAIHIRKTGGSTGQSVYFYYDDDGLDWTAAINLAAYDMAHNYRHRKDCHVSSELGLYHTKWKPKFLDWLKLFSQNRTRLMISSFSDDDLCKNVYDLVKIKPFLLQGHPSSAFALAEYVKRNNKFKKKYFNVFEPSGEMLTKKIVSSIEENLGAKVVNRYGNAEFGVVAHSRFDDPYNKLKVFDRAFYMERCEDSNIIVTGLTNFGMPLIRYNTGDIATVRGEEDGTYMYDIRGRVHDAVLINDESFATHYIMDYLDHKIRNVREFQIVLNSLKRPTLRIVPEDPNDSDRIKNAVIQRWPEGIDVEFIGFEQLQKVGWRQKFRHVIDTDG